MDLRRALAAAVLAGAVLQAAPALAAPPANDNFTNAQALSGTSVSVSGTTFGATAEAGEPGADSSRHSVWYSWTAPQDMVVQLDTCNPTAQLVTRIYSGTTFASLVELDARDDEPFPFDCPAGTFGVPHMYDVTGGTTYAIQVFQLFVAQDAAFTLSLNATPRPANDDFAVAQDLGQALEVDLDGTTVGASTESGEPGYSDGGNSVWYRWTAPKRTRVWLDNCDAETNSSRVTVYKGASLAGLTEVDPNLDDLPHPAACEGNGDRQEFLATEGTTYMIQVATRLRDQGAFHLRLQAIRFDASLHQEASAKKIKKGRTVTFTIDVENVGTLDMDTNVDMVTSKPNHLTRPAKGTKYVSVDGTNGTSCKPVMFLANPHAGARCKIDLKAGESTRIVAKVKPGESLSHWAGLAITDENLDNEDEDPVNVVVKKKRKRRL